MISGESAAPAVGVVLVNWNRWRDTVEVLESLLRSTVPVRVIVVDNASADGSLDQIEAWARGELPEELASKAMARFSQPALAKPVKLRRLGPGDLAAAVSGPGDGVTLIDSGGNLGFAGGNNVGLKLLLTDPAIGCFWLLNNDTVVEADAAEKLAATMAAAPGIGMCGTVVRFYWSPDTVQALGGYRFNVWTGAGKAIHDRLPATMPFDKAQVIAQTDFVLGASLAVSRPFLESVGLMEDDYFLYFEEIDWAVRNNRRGNRRFAIGFADGATVYHKEGGSIGSSGIKGQRSVMADYWLNRSRLGFIRRHYPWLLPWHWLFTLALVGRRLMRGQPEKARVLLKALTGG